MIRKVKKAGTKNPVGDVAGTATEQVLDQVVDLINESLEKKIEDLNGGKLPELTVSNAEILKAQDELTDVGGQVARVKPVMLSIEADDQRKKDLENAYGKSKRDGRRMNLIAGHNFVEKHFAGRPNDSVTLDEYVAYRDTAFAALPVEAGDFQFTQEANNFVRSCWRDKEAAICEIFKGRYNVTLGEIQDPAMGDRILMKQAEIFIASRPQGKKAVKIDAGGPVRCQSSPKCTRLFVPLSWLEYDREKQQEHWTGNLLITRDGDLKWFCPPCRAEGRKHGIPFFSSQSAARVAGRAQERSIVRDGIRASIKDAIGYHETPQDRRDERPQISEDRKRRASRNLFALMGGESGEYLVVPPDWDVGGEDERKVVDTWILIESKGFNSVKILGAGLGFGRYVGDSFIRGNLPPAIFAAIKKDQAAQ